MEEKEPVKIKVSTVIFIIVILALVGVIIYFVNQNNILLQEQEQISDKMQTMQKDLEKSKENVVELQNETNTDVQNTAESNISNTNTNTTANSNKTTNATDKYKEITKKLNGEDVLEVTNTTKNNDGTYTLKGRISTVDTSKKMEAEYPPRKYTGEYKQITVPGNTKCVYSVDSTDEKTDTVANVFSKKLAFGDCFNFKFKNGKCIEVYEVVIGH